MEKRKNVLEDYIILTLQVRELSQIGELEEQAAYGRPPELRCENELTEQDSIGRGQYLEVGDQKCGLGILIWRGFKYPHWRC